MSSQPLVDRGILVRPERRQKSDQMGPVGQCRLENSCTSGGQGEAVALDPSACFPMTIHNFLLMNCLSLRQDSLAMCGLMNTLVDLVGLIFLGQGLLRYQCQTN